MKIKSVKGFEVLDSRGNPTVAAKVVCENGAEGFAVTVNKEKIDVEDENGYLLIERVWQSSDTVELKFRAPVKMSVINGRIAFTKGPVALARDKRLDGAESPVSITVKDGKSVRARRIKNTVFNSNITLEVETKDGKIILSDYAQAGKNYDDENTGITVWNDVN